MKTGRAMRGRFLPAIAAFAIAASACGDDPTGRIPSRSALEEAASVLRWPDGIPSGSALERFADPTAAARPTATDVAERANMCAWYAYWLAVTRGEASGDRADIEAYLAQVIPNFTSVMSANGTPWAQGVAAAAAEGDAAPIERFIDENDCELLD
jgi:hypothetical protein